MFFLSVFFGNAVQAQELEGYLRMAAENNPNLQANYSEFEASLEQSPQVSSLPDPTLTVGAFGGMETLMGAERANFQLMQMFPWFGTLRAKSKTADLLAEAKFQQYLVSRNELFFEVKKKYAELFEIEKTIALKEANLEILDSYRDLAMSKFRSGNSNMVNVVRIDIERDGALTEIELLRDELETMEREFNLLLNRNINEEVKVQDTLVFNAKSSAEKTFKNHPELNMIDREVEANQTRAEVAKKEGLPMLGLGVDYTIFSRSENAVPHMNGQNMIMPMVSVSLPIFRKKYKAARKEAERMETAALQTREALKNDLQSDYERTIYELKKAEKLLQLYERQIKSSGQANKLLVSAFANDTGDFEEILSLNQDILMLNTQKITALKEGFTAQARMEYLSFKTEKYHENE